MKTRLLAAIAAGALCLAASGPSLAQDANWPVKPLRLLVGSAPAARTDAMARAVADKLGPRLGQTVVVEKSRAPRTRWPPTSRPNPATRTPW